MKKIDVDELKKIQLKMMVYIDQFCRENGIEYWLTAGTLLGAVRHKGFIPWDDDIDIGMKRTDYNKFMTAFNNDQKSQYTFRCYENDPGYPYQMGKVLDNNTVLYEPNQKSGYKIAVYIDVFVYDQIPNDEAVIKKLYDTRDRLKKIRTLRNADRHMGTKIRQAAVGTVSHLLKVFPTQYLVKKIVMNGKEYRMKDTGYLGDLVGDDRAVIDESIVDELIDFDFEGYKMLGPAKYDEWLKLFFGNYMELPPVEQRVSHHDFEAYYL